jgi:hypothetical protein
MESGRPIGAQAHGWDESTEASSNEARADSLEAFTADEELWAIQAATDPSAVLQEVAEQTSYGEIFLNDLIRRQRRLSLSVAGVFFAILFGLPALNSVAPMIMALPILGIPLTGGGTHA